MPKQLGQTVLDFPQQQEAAFDKWLRASEMQDFKKAADNSFLKIHGVTNRVVKLKGQGIVNENSGGWHPCVISQNGG